MALMFFFFLLLSQNKIAENLVRNSQPSVSFSVITASGYIPLPARVWSSETHYVGSRSVVVTLTEGASSFLLCS